MDREPKPTKSLYELVLNDTGIPENEKKSNEGQIPDSAKYGTWLRKYDTDLFNVNFKAWAYWGFN